MKVKLECVPRVVIFNDYVRCKIETVMYINDMLELFIASNCALVCKSINIVV